MWHDQKHIWIQKRQWSDLTAIGEYEIASTRVSRQAQYKIKEQNNNRHNGSWRPYHGQ